MLSNGRTSYFTPCPKQIQVKECFCGMPKQHTTMLLDLDGKSAGRKTDNLGCAVFHKTPEDDKPGLSMEGRRQGKESNTIV